MGPIYSYLIAWIAGGVLLASGMLLERVPAPAPTAHGATATAHGATATSVGANATSDGATESLGSDAQSSPDESPGLPGRSGRSLPRPWFSLLWLGLLAYGGLGLLLEALGALAPEVRPLCAASAGLTLFGVSWLLLLRRA